MTKIRGRVVRMLPVEQGLNKQNQPWRKYTWQIDQPSNGEPIPIYLSAFNDRADQLNLQPGYDYEFDITIRGREYNGKQYHDISLNFAQPINNFGGFAPQPQYGGGMPQNYSQQPYQPQAAPQSYGFGAQSSQPMPQQQYPQQQQQYGQQTYPTQQPAQQNPYGQATPQQGSYQPQQPAAPSPTPSPAPAQQPYNQPSPQPAQAAPAPSPAPAPQPQAAPTAAPQQGYQQPVQPQGQPMPQQQYPQQPPMQGQPMQQPYGQMPPQPAPMPQGALPDGVDPENDDLPF